MMREQRTPRVVDRLVMEEKDDHIQEQQRSNYARGHRAREILCGYPIETPQGPLYKPLHAPTLWRQLMDCITETKDPT